MFEKLIKMFRKQPDSKTTAKSRLQLILIQDRTGIEPGILEMLKEDLIDLLSKYFEISQSGLEMNLHREEKTMALIANVPITGMNTRRINGEKQPEKSDDEPQKLSDDAPQELSAAKASV